MELVILEAQLGTLVCLHTTRVLTIPINTVIARYKTDYKLKEIMQ